jgi:protoporphyrinogen oxidase
MFSAREGSAQKEQLGYICGGYKTVFDRLLQNIAAAGGTVRTGVTVTRIEPAAVGGITLVHDGRTEHFDKVVFTSPTNVLRQVASARLFELEQPESDIEYLGVICMALVTEKPLNSFYVTNIADQRVPFTGIIGMSNLVSTAETGGLHLTYLPKYVDSTSPLLGRSDDQLRTEFLAGLRLMYPDIDSLQIVSTPINRAAKVQPLQVLNYSRLVPRVESAHADFFVLNTAQFTHVTLNNNEVIRAVDDFVATYGSRFAADRALTAQQDTRCGDEKST